MGSPLTMALANIYMLEWEQSLIEHQRSNNELYGRYVKKISFYYCRFIELFYFILIDLWMMSL